MGAIAVGAVLKSRLATARGEFVPWMADLTSRSVAPGIVLMQNDHAENYPCGHGRVLRFCGTAR